MNLPIIMAAMFFVWSASYFWGAIGASWLNGLSAFVWLIVALFSFVVIGSSRRNMKPPILLALGFSLVLVAAFLFDTWHPYKIELYLKTFLFVVASLSGGAAFFSILNLQFVNERDFSQWIGILSGLFVVGYFSYAVTLGWRPGATLLGTDLGDFYQGMSRLLSFAVVVVAAVSSTLNMLFVFVVLLTAFILILAFNSAGALLGLMIALMWLAISSIRNGRGHWAARSLGMIIIGCVFVYCIVLFDITTVVDGFADGLMHKVSSEGVDYHSRPWLILSGLTFWTSSLNNFLFGPGALNYSCAVDYCVGYRHPHNLFVLGAVWFGVPSVPLSVFWITTAYRSIKYLMRRNLAYSLFPLLYLNYFLLSMVGGDWEQNRHLFFCAGFVWAMFIYDKRRQQLLRTTKT
jgi:hypothetical protein